MSPSQHFGSSDEGAARPGKRSAGRAAPRLPRVVTTGRKNAGAPGGMWGNDGETGEDFLMVATGRGVSITRHLSTVEAAPRKGAFIDACAFSVVPPAERSYVWVLEQMSRFLDIESFEQRAGRFGFKHSARFGEGAGVVCWGGESQRGRVYFSLMGKGCAMVRDWAGLAGWLQAHRAVLKRADAAYDDFEGRLVSIAWAVSQYSEGGFNAGGRKPSHAVHGDWLDGEASTKGRTLTIGNRASGKHCRIYEKGKQLGEAVSKWTRVEVEWRAEDRYIPFDILTRPGHYLAGAYPCLAFVDEEQSVIKTVARGAEVAFDKAVRTAKQHSGKLVNLLLQVTGGDYVEVVNRLIRPGIPARIDPYSYHLRRNPGMLDWQQRGAPA